MTAGAALPASSEQAAFREELIERGLLLETGVAGLYGHGAVFEELRLRFDALLSAAAAADADTAETMRFPPLLPRVQLERSGYLHSFPQLAGSVFAFAGTEADAQEQEERASRHEDWSEHQRMSEVALVPAACYPVYPVLAARGTVPASGATVDAGAAWVFRHEPSDDPARLQSFRQRELVRVGSAEQVLAWRERWQQRGLRLLRSLGLEASLADAADPFFGRAGRLLAAGQREQQLKHELVVALGGAAPTAVTSFNYHQQHFAALHGLNLADDSTAHTACLGFGEERVVLALLYAHGSDPDRWPSAVRAELWPA